MAEEHLISFIIPVYNEELNIENVLRNLHQVLSHHPEWKSEVVIIEDGSLDKTKDTILKVSKKYAITKLILHKRNQGYARSLKDGILQATGKYVVYIGADEEFDCSELPQFISPLLKNEADVVLGVRWQRNAYQLFRFFLSVIYIFFLNYLFKLRVNDYNWSQAWPRELFDRIELKSESLFILPEIVIKAHDLKYRVKEVPSNHRGRQFGKSSLNFHIMGRALLDSILFWNYRKSKRYTPERQTTKRSPLKQSVTIDTLR